MKIEAEASSNARLQTTEELSGLLFVVQDMGRRLADEAHGEDDELIRKFNNLLQQARAALMLIKQTE